MSRHSRLAGLAVALATTLGLVAAPLVTVPAAATHSPGTTSLVEVLAADGDDFDRNQWDYDIVFQAALAVLDAKPDSPVGLLADGSVALTAFVPNDRAFRKLAKDLTGTWYRSEADVFAALAAAVGVETIEAVLLYHVVPGVTIDYRTAKHSDGAVLATALTDATLTVDVRRWAWWRVVTLVDNDPDARNAVVLQPNLNKGNLQIAHGISRVLRPLDL